MSSIGVVVLHHDRTVVEQIAEVLERAPDVFVAATSLDAGVGASVVVAGGDDLLTHERMPAPLVALADGEAMPAARAALRAGAADLVQWPSESARIVAAIRRAATLVVRTSAAGSAVSIAGARGGLGASTVAALLASFASGLLIDVTGGQRAFVDTVEPVGLPGEVDATLIAGMAVPHVGGSSAIHLKDPPGPLAARGLLAAAKQAAAAVVVDAGRHEFDVDRRVIITGCDVASVNATRARMRDGDLVVMRRTRGSLGVRDVAAALSRPIVCVIPDDPSVTRAADRGKLPGGRVLRAVAALAREIGFAS